MESITKQEIQRFNSKWKQVENCKIWQNYLDKDGYGNFYFRKKLRRAHRVSYYINKGDIPKKMVVDHICRNRNCIEINHLRLITAKQNSLENSNSVGAINAKKIFCKNGHRFDKKYGKQRYCSICENEKSKRLQKKWREEANKVMC